MSQAWKDLFRNSAVLKFTKSNIADGKQPPPILLHLDHFDVPGLSGDVESFRILISFLDLTCGAYVGQTKEVKGARRSIAQGNRIEFGRTLFFLLPDNNPYVVLVVQLASGERPADVLCGWTILFPTRDVASLKDAAEGSEWDLKYESLYTGTPRCIHAFQGQGFKELVRSMVVTNPPIVVAYAFQTSALSLPTTHLMPYFLMLTPSNSVPGIQQISDEGFPIWQPTCVETASCAIEGVVVDVGAMGEELEMQLCGMLNNERLLTANRLPDGFNMIVTERRLNIGIHNGWRFIAEPIVCHLAIENATGTRRGSNKTHVRTRSSDSKSSTGAGHYYLRSPVQLEDVPNDKDVAIIFELELVLMLQNHEPNPPMRNVLMGWGAWCPFDADPTLWAQTTLFLSSGNSRNPNQTRCFTNARIAKSANITNVDNLPGLHMQFSFFCGSTPRPRVYRASSVPMRKSSVPEQSHLGITSPPQLTPSTQLPPFDMRSPTPQPPSRSGRLPLEKILPETVRGLQTQDSLPFSYPATPSALATGHMGYFPPVMMGNLAQGRDNIPQMSEIPHTSRHTQSVIQSARHHMMHGATAVSRAAFAIISQIPFEKIVDRHAEAPEIINVHDLPQLQVELEVEDALSVNEIIIQFQAMSQPSVLINANEAFPRSVFFTFQFYRFSQTSTERLVLSSVDPGLGNNLPLVLRRESKTGTLIGGSPGYQVQYIVDPSYLKPGEYRLFLHYLHENSLHVDIWDADSLLLVGSAMLPLRTLLRCTREAVQTQMELPVVTSQFWPNTVSSENRSDQSAGFHSWIAGYLYLNVANIGHPSAMPWTADLVTKNQAVIVQSLKRSTRNSGFLVRSKTVTHAKSLFSQYPDLRNTALLHQKTSPFPSTDQNMSVERKRKLQRLESFKQAGLNRFDRTNRDILERDLQTIKQLRGKDKHASITMALYESIGTVHTIYPILGAAEVFEFLVENPLNVPITTAVEISSPKVTVISDANEWQFYTRLLGLQTPLEKDLFAQVSAPNSLQTTNEPMLFLRPKEAVYIPFKYQNFSSMQSNSQFDDTGAFIPLPSMLNESETIKITLVNTAANGTPIAFLILQVEPQPQTVHQYYRFSQPETFSFSKQIQFSNPSGAPVLAVATSDPNVLCDISPVGSRLPSSIDVLIKTSTGVTPSVKSFFVLLYEDPYKSRPIQVWQLFLHAFQKLDIYGIQGHGSKLSIVLKGTDASSLMSIHSSIPNEISLHPSDPFMLRPGESREIVVLYKPLLTGERVSFITAVDLEVRRLVKSWMLCAEIKPPNITRAFQVSLPIGTSDGLSKRISFSNPYQCVKLFQLSTSNDTIMRVKLASLRLEPEASGSINLRFSSSNTPTVRDEFLFINDEYGNSEATYGVKIVYS